MQVALSTYPMTREVKKFRVEGKILSLDYLASFYSLSRFLTLTRAQGKLVFDLFPVLPSQGSGASG